jgi:hypothetical protein
MFTDVAAGDLIGNPLIAERTQQPIEYFGRISLRDRLNDTCFLRIGADIVKKGQRSRQTTNFSDQINRANIVLGKNVGSSAGLSSRRFLRRLANWIYFRIRDTNLRCASLSPSMYPCVVWIER